MEVLSCLDSITLHFPFFCSCFVPVFLAHVILSLAYLNLLGIKRLDYCY
jgi:hypothetical protein